TDPVGGADHVRELRRRRDDLARSPAGLRLLPGLGHPVHPAGGGHPQGGRAARVGAQAPERDRARRRHHAHRPRRGHGQRRLAYVDDLPARSGKRDRSGELAERKTAGVETTPTESGSKSAAKSGKSTKPGAKSGAKSGKSAKSTVSPPQLGFWGMCRWAWTQLTTMRVALILLLVLALAAIPGSLLPQRIQ